MKTYFRSLSVIAVCLGMQLECYASWTITTPADNATINNNANVSCSGTASAGNIDYSCSIIHKHGSGPRMAVTIISSVSGVSNASSWSCTLSLMSGNWPNGVHFVKLEPVGYSGADIEHKITFVNP